MDDGHFLSFATVSLGVVLFFVLSIGGLMLHLYLRELHLKEREEDRKKQGPQDS